MTLQIKTLEGYHEAYKQSVDNPEEFWAEQAESFTWSKKWDSVLDWDFKGPDINWFSGGKLNITENCLDRHLANQGDKVALLFEPNDPQEEHRSITYKELHAQVCKCANALKARGIVKGDRVVFYMPMVPELAIGVLACARIGAVHSVVFAGFSAQALSDRINDAQAKMVICSDFNRRGSKNIPVKKVVDDAMTLGCDSIESVLVHRNTGEEVNIEAGRDHW